MVIRRVLSIFLIGSLLFLTGSVMRATGRSEMSSPPTSTVICEEPVADLGAVVAGSEVEHVFYLVNHGTTAVMLDDIKPDCGCILIDRPSRLVVPGETVTLKVRVSINETPGAFVRTIVVGSAEPSQSKLILRIQGTSVAAAAISPATVDWGPIAPDDVRNVTLKLDSLRPLQVVATSPNLHAHIESIVPNKLYHLHIATQGRLPLGHFFHNVVVKVEHPVPKELIIPITAQVIDGIGTTPSEIVWAGAGTRDLTIHVLSTSKLDFRIQQVEVPSGFPAVAVTPSANGYNITAKNIAVLPKLHGNSIRIGTDHPNAQSVEIPIRLVGFADR